MIRDVVFIISQVLNLAAISAIVIYAKDMRTNFVRYTASLHP